MNRLFSCGNGSTYALGHGNKETCKGFKQIQFFNGEQSEGAQVTGVGITTIACGLMHSGCVLTDGSVYQWGTCGDYAKLKEIELNKLQIQTDIMKKMYWESDLPPVKEGAYVFGMQVEVMSDHRFCLIVYNFTGNAQKRFPQHITHPPQNY